MKPLHISLNTAHSGCKPRTFISSFTHSYQVFLPLPCHHHIPTGRHPIILILTFHMPKPKCMLLLLLVVVGIRPCTNIKKPLCIANDYVFNLLEGHQVSANASTLFRCHLCEHSPFLSQKLWKGHLFLVHKVKSADVTRNKSVDTTGDNPIQIRMDSNGVFQLGY